MEIFNERYELEFLRNDLMSKLREDKENRDYYMFTKRLVVARAINIYLEDSMHLKLTNRILQMAKKEGILDEEEYMFWTSYGIEKTEFIVGLLNNGREYLEEKLREQTS